MPGDDTISKGRRTGGFASRLLHKAMSERNKKNPLESHRIKPDSDVEKITLEENKLTTVVSEVSN